MPERVPAGRIVPRVGISACLLGQRVRYDGGHKKDGSLVALGKRVEWVPVCPEVEAGMGVPRDAMSLVGRTSSPRLVVEKTGEDRTRSMRSFAKGRVAALEALGLDGYVLKARSPSCGVEGVPVHRAAGTVVRKGRGLFARVLIEGMPRLPVAEDEWLHDRAFRAAWLAKVVAHARARHR